MKPRRLRSTTGIVLAALIAVGAFASPASAQDAQGTIPISYRSRVQPTYPESALKNHEAGVVMLMVLVGPDGVPIRTVVDPAHTTAPQDLVDAARSAAMQWRFNPEIKNGKPVEAIARVPITFNDNRSLMQGFVPDMTYNGRIEPRYPPAAIRNHEQGVVTLDIHVLANGQTGVVTFDPAASTTTAADLIAAATDAVRQTPFTPRSVAGKPADGMLRLPIAFKLGQAGPTARSIPVTNDSSPST